MNIIDVATDPELLGRTFGNESFAAWRAVDKTVFGLPMTEDELAIYRECTGRSEPPQHPAKRAWLIMNRRAGKTLAAARYVVFLATCRDYTPILAPGERATIPLIASDRRQARVAMRYVNGLLDSSPMLAALVERRKAESVDLKNRVTIEIHTATFRGVRGYTIPAVVLDEICFWRSDEESTDPDTEIVAALRPALATVPGSLLIAISSPYSRRGVMWQAYERHFGKDGDDLVWQAGGRRMNPNVSQAVIDDAMEEDESSARAEWLAEFRRDVESYVSREHVDAAVIGGRVELPASGTIRYRAFVDAAGGSGADSMTMAISHSEGDREILDRVDEVRPPFSPDAVVQDFAAVLRNYRVTFIRGDRFAGSWVTERFSKHGITYVAAAKPKSEIYAAFLPLLTSGRVELLDHPHLKKQLLGLERRTARGGRDSIDHPPRSHDDVINAAAGALCHGGVWTPPITTMEVEWG